MLNHNHRAELGPSPRYVVEGERFPSFKVLFQKARSRGYAGTDRALYWRWTHGFHTWAALLAPMSAQSEHQKKRQARMHDEMRAVCAELDARKRAMGLDDE